jgi:hypothetical protein
MRPKNDVIDKKKIIKLIKLEDVTLEKHISWLKKKKNIYIYIYII